MAKKNCNIIILFVFCFLMLGCFHKNPSADMDEIIMATEDLKKTIKINIKAANTIEVIRTLSNKNEIHQFIDIIMSSEIIGDDENIVYIGPSYILEMIDENGNLFETINLFIPYGVPGFVKLNQLNELYYVDIDKVLAILNIQKDL